MYRQEVTELRAKMEQGKARDCFAVHFLQNPSTGALVEEQILFSLGSLMEAGSDTSRMVISQIIAAAATDPRWLHILRDELDSVCGGKAERLSELSDRDSLPYMSAVTKEAFRWRPFAEIGVPHCLTKDDGYEGYRFPKGTLFTWNAWHVSMSEDEYDNPASFVPERWSDREELLADPLEGHWSFGPGRSRVCRLRF